MPRAIVHANPCTPRGVMGVLGVCMCAHVCCTMDGLRSLRERSDDVVNVQRPPRCPQRIPNRNKRALARTQETLKTEPQASCVGVCVCVCSRLPSSFAPQTRTTHTHTHTLRPQQSVLAPPLDAIKQFGQQIYLCLRFSARSRLPQIAVDRHYNHHQHHTIIIIIMSTKKCTTQQPAHQ